MVCGGFDTVSEGDDTVGGGGDVSVQGVNC